MKKRDSQTLGSPVKSANFTRGNTRVFVHSSPRSMARLRPGIAGQKFISAQQSARKPSNPIRRAVADTDEWQDVEDQGHNRPLSLLKGPELKPKIDHDEPEIKYPTLEPLAEKKPDLSPESHRKEAYRSENFRSQVDRNRDDSDDTSSSFMSPRSVAKFMGKLKQYSKKHARRVEDSDETPDVSGQSFLGGQSGYFYNGQKRDQSEYAGAHEEPTQRPPFWMDPALPGLLALYLQVSFNLIMVLIILYAIAVFYATIRNDVNLKVEEYSVDIVDQISKCSFEYVRNGCEPGKRVPAIEAACQQWERCMQRDPKEVGRARVSAETFGTIIEAFIQPIGFKSMIFLFVLFAGSFLLVNCVFSSRIGPRYNASHQHFASPSPHAQNFPPPHGDRPSSSQHISQSYPPRFMQQPSIVYTPAHVPSPRYRDIPLQSSPVRHSSYHY